MNKLATITTRFRLLDHLADGTSCWYASLFPNEAQALDTLRRRHTEQIAFGSYTSIYQEAIDEKGHILSSSRVFTTKPN